MGDIIFPYLEDLINQIPKGKITTFKILSEFLGSQYAIKYILNNYRKCKYWYRVINEKGIIYDEKQKELLKNEGIEIEDNVVVNIDRYLFKDFNVKEKILEKYRRIQNELREKIILEDRFNKIEIIGGVDLSYKDDIGFVVFVLLDKNLNLLEYRVFKEEINFPYIPTFLAFREGEPIIKNFNKIRRPDILFVNGVGIAHPVKMGLATYIGTILNIPTIGVTKSLLYGNIKEDIIYDDNENIIGYVIKKFGNKIYVSPGNLISLNTAKILSEKFWINGKYPEPIRIADKISKKIKD